MRLRGCFRLLVPATLLLALNTVSPPPGSAQSPQPYANTMRPVSASSALPAPELCQVADGWLYTIGSGSLRVADLSDPVAPVVVGQLDTLGTVLDFAVAGDRVLLARGAAGLCVIDLADRAHPVIAGTMELAAGATAVAWYGDLAAVAGSGVLYLLNVDHPRRIRIVEETPTIVVADLAIHGDYALVTGDEGIATIDFATRGHPAQVALFRDDLGPYSEGGIYPTFGAIVVDGDRAAVTSMQPQLFEEPMGSYIGMAPYVVVLDVSLPPALANVAGYSCGARSLLLRDDRVVVTTTTNDVMAFATETMAFRGSLHDPLTLGASAWGERYLYARCGSGLAVFDLEYPETVIPFATWAPDFNHNPASARVDLATRYTANGGVTVLDWRLYDTTDPLVPELRLSGAFDYGWDGWASVSIDDVEGDYVLMSSYTSASFGPVYSIVNMAANPATRVYLNATAGDWAQIALSGTTAWVKTAFGTLVAVDFSDFSNVHATATIPVPSGSLVVQDAGACLLRSAPYQMTMLDLTDPASPQVAGSVALPNLARYCLFRDNLAYVGCASADLQVVDVSDPQAPTVVGTLYTPFEDTWIAGAADRAVIANSSGFQLISLADARHPQLLSQTVSVTQLSNCPVMSGSRLYAGHSWGLNVYDMTDPTQVGYVGCGSGKAGRACGAADWIIVPGAAYPLDAAGAVIVGKAAGQALPSPITLGGAAPNPFNPRTTVRFTLDRARTVDLGVYDLRGARRRILTAGSLEAGEHAVVWDGLDDAGRRLASGPYFVRLRTADCAFTRTAKVTLVK